jgi:DNA-directed RNA polymerase specialized sigma24 family protein
LQKIIDKIDVPMTGSPKSASDQGLGPAPASTADAWISSLAALGDLLPSLFPPAWLRAKCLQLDVDEPALREFLSKLHIQELLLARACAAGNVAWEEFLLRYREPLFDTGIAIARDYGVGRELADSLYADLYGAGNSQGISPLNSYMGYGSLEGWLRTIMARSFIDRHRSERRLVSLEEETDEGWQPAAPSVEPKAAVDPRLEQATDQALAALDSEDRFFLASLFSARPHPGRGRKKPAPA